MKRIIDIDDEVYDWLCNGFPDNYDIEMLYQITANSKPLNEVFDKITDEVEKVNAPRCRDDNNYFKGRTDAVERVLDIINKYKESEGKR